MRKNGVVRLGLFSMCSFVFALQLAHADVVTDWNERAVTAGYTARVTPGVSARCIAMVHLAMFEALNSIEPRYTPYRTRLATESSASREAAAASAAHYLMVRLYSDQAKEMDKALEASLAAVPDGPPKTEGMRLGEQAARVMFEERRADGADAPRHLPTLYGRRQVRSHRLSGNVQLGRSPALRADERESVRPRGPLCAHQYAMGKGLHRS